MSRYEERQDESLKSIEILYQDDHYIAVDKPSGLFVHKSDFDRRADYVLRIVRDMAGCLVWPVHRLDRPTSGVLIFALSRDAASRLSDEFRSRRVAKEYLAVVRGYTDDAGVIDYPLKAESDDKPRDAVSRYQTILKTELPYPVGRYNTARYSLVKIFPETGRYHQIRKHFAHIFHPVIGDSVHGDGKHNRLIRETFGVGRLLLAATVLKFNHPYRGLPVLVEAPVESGMQSVIDAMFI